MGECVGQAGGEGACILTLYICLAHTHRPLLNKYPFQGARVPKERSERREMHLHERESRRCIIIHTHTCRLSFDGEKEVCVCVHVERRDQQVRQARSLVAARNARRELMRVARV